MPAASKYFAQSKLGASLGRSANAVGWSCSFGSRSCTLSNEASARRFSKANTVWAFCFACSAGVPASSNIFATCSRYFARASTKRGSVLR